MKKWAPFVIICLLLMVVITKAVIKKQNVPVKSRVVTEQNVSKTQPVEPVTPKPSAPEVKLSKEPVRGIYVTSWVSGSQRMADIIAFIKANKDINAIVIDVKDDTGVISYPSNIPLAREIGSTSKRIADLPKLVKELKEAGIYTIARIVVFKDPLLATKHTDWAVKDRNGSLWRDRKGMIWVDPHSRNVWKYNLDIAKEVIQMGFSEVQFDYVRFLSDGKISQAVYPFSKGEAHEDVIHNFLKYSKTEINRMGVPLSADIFGLVLSVPDDLNIGQKFEKIADAVDYISPMVYPSHYPKGTFNLDNPDKHPYEVVSNAMKDAIRRIPDIHSKMRPWLQDFDLGNPYGRAELMAQIKALNELGISEWLLWNPRNRYDPPKYNF